MPSANAETEYEPTVSLLTASNYVILAKDDISTLPNSVITGDIAAGAMTGFSLTLDLSGQFSTSSQVVGKAFAANYAAHTEASLTSAVSAMEAAYTNAASRVNTNTERINLGGGNLGSGNLGGGLFGGGLISLIFGGADAPLTPGVYTFNTGDVTIGSDITFSGSSTDIFIIQISGDLVQTASTNVSLSGGARVANIFWQIAGDVEVGAGAHMEGILVVKADVTFKTGSSLSGRVLSQTSCNLQRAMITEPTV
jgi:hypothetical protein